jgi:SAM-dependent methyltransferase
MPSPLLSNTELENSTVVANNRMNRERQLSGVNSYQKELSIDFQGFLLEQAGKQVAVHWMDLCCGAGNALIQAGMSLRSNPEWNRIHLEGLDLVGMFSAIPAELEGKLTLRVGSVVNWEPAVAYDLITCVHGIHYLGDKLGLIHQALTNLRDDGMLVVNLDPQNFKDGDGRPMLDWWKAQWKQKGWHYHPRRHLLQVVGKQDWPVTWEYLGADDQAGPNYSGQPVVDSYYRLL